MYVYTTVNNDGQSDISGLDGMTVWDESWDAKIWTHLSVKYVCVLSYWIVTYQQKWCIL